MIIVEHYEDLGDVLQICAILHGVLTKTSDLGRFEQYRNITYPTRPDKIN